MIFLLLLIFENLIGLHHLQVHFCVKFTNSMREDLLIFLKMHIDSRADWSGNKAKECTDSMLRDISWGLAHATSYWQSNSFFGSQAATRKVKTSELLDLNLIRKPLAAPWPLSMHCTRPAQESFQISSTVKRTRLALRISELPREFEAGDWAASFTTYVVNLWVHFVHVADSKG